MKMPCSRSPAAHARAKQSVKRMRRACALAPEQAHSHSLLGAALHALGNFDEALACHLQALAPADGPLAHPRPVPRYQVPRTARPPLRAAGQRPAGVKDQQGLAD